MIFFRNLSFQHIIHDILTSFTRNGLCDMRNGNCLSLLRIQWNITIVVWIRIDINMIQYFIERIWVFIILEEKMGFLIKSEVELIVKYKEIVDITNKMIWFIDIFHMKNTFLIPFFNRLCCNLRYLRSTLFLLYRIIIFGLIFPFLSEANNKFLNNLQEYLINLRLCFIFLPNMRRIPGKAKLIAQIMRGKIIHNIKLNLHLRREYNLNQIKRKIKLNDKMKWFINLQQFEYFILIFHFNMSLLFID